MPDGDMRTLISHEIRKTAEFLIFASKLDFNKIQEIMDDLKAIAKDSKNFKKGSHPLSLSPQGLRKVKETEPSIAAENLFDVIRKVNDAIKAGAIDNDDMDVLKKYIERRLQGKWISLKLPNDTAQAQKAIIDSAIEPMIDLLQLLRAPGVRPFERKGPVEPAGPSMSPEKFKSLEPYLHKSLKQP